MSPPETAGNGHSVDDLPPGCSRDGSAPETCRGCGLAVPSAAAWKRAHDDERCDDACWCAAYCWMDGRCEPKPEDELARARAEAFEECARIADARAVEFSYRLPTLVETGGDTLTVRAQASEASKIAELIRRRIKP